MDPLLRLAAKLRSASADHRARHQMCERKVAFPKQRDAIARAKVLSKQEDRVFEAYACNLCKQWHLTKKRYGEEEAA